MNDNHRETKLTSNKGNVIRLSSFRPDQKTEDDLQSAKEFLHRMLGYEVAENIILRRAVRGYAMMLAVNYHNNINQGVDILNFINSERSALKSAARGE